VAILPTLVTLGNGICGMGALLMLLQPEPDHLHAAWLILAGMVFDGLDGMVARATRTASGFGAQLDSLCDALTFGVAPAAIVMSLMTRVYAMDHNLSPMLVRVLWAISIFYASCAIVRLARFNVESATDDSHQNFAGLPSPGAGGTVASAVITYYFLVDSPEWRSFGTHSLAALPVMTFFLGLLMVSRVPYTHVMNRHLRGFRPFTTFVEVALVIVLLVILHQVAVFVVFFGYSMTGVIAGLRRLVFAPGPRAPAPEPPNDPSVR
jgi:CDP-diacylglycerol--serine O-phosphatidyltransferase